MPRDCGQDPPARRFAAELIAWHQPDHPASEQYRQLAAALRQNAGGQSHILLCTSLKADIRATAVVLNLAISLARQEELSVVVVDGRTVEPALDSQLGLRSQTGLAEVLAGIESLETALQETGVTNLAALTAGREDPARRLRALDETCRPVLRQLRDRFNMVLIDGAPCQMSGEARGLETACDAVYVVLPAREAETPDTAECLRALHVQGIPIRGCILLG
jgi:Mrp family chromosome partitioning ATPase